MTNKNKKTYFKMKKLLAKYKFTFPIAFSSSHIYQTRRGSSNLFEVTINAIIALNSL